MQILFLYFCWLRRAPHFAAICGLTNIAILGKKVPNSKEIYSEPATLGRMHIGANRF
jgi:hypothetical protein